MLLYTKMDTPKWWDWCFHKYMKKKEKDQFLLINLQSVNDDFILHPYNIISGYQEILGHVRTCFSSKFVAFFVSNK